MISNIRKSGSNSVGLETKQLGWVGLVSLFNGISTFLGYLMSMPSAVELFNP